MFEWFIISPKRRIDFRSTIGCSSSNNTIDIIEVSVILSDKFIYSNPTDIQSAIPFASELKRNGDTLIVISITNKTNTDLLRLIASDSNHLFDIRDYNGYTQLLADKINAAICFG